MTFEKIKQNAEVCALIRKGNENLGVLGYTDHSQAHCTVVAEQAARILSKLGYSKKDIELKRKIVHPIDWDASNSRYSNLQWVSSVELSIMKSINDGQTEIVDFVRYACILMSHGYSDKDIKAVLDMPIKGFIAKIRKREI